MVRRLKGKQCTAEFIFLTAHQKFTYVHSALKLEAMDYLLKPFRYEDLEECIEKVRVKRHKLDETEEQELLLTQRELQVKNSYIKDAVAYVRNHYAEDISNVTAAEQLDINSAYFCRLFKKETGYTVTQIALSFINSQYDFVGIPVIFSRTHEQFTDSLSAADTHLTPDMVDFLLKED